MRIRNVAVFVASSVVGAVAMVPVTAHATWSQLSSASSCQVIGNATGAGLSGYTGWGSYFVDSNTSTAAQLECPFVWTTTNPDKSVTSIWTDAYVNGSAGAQICVEACYAAHDWSSKGCSTAACSSTSSTGWVNPSPSATNWSSDTGGTHYDAMYVTISTTSSDGMYFQGFVVDE